MLNCKAAHINMYVSSFTIDVNPIPTYGGAEVPTYVGAED
jgi:hypothetical protein